MGMKNFLKLFALVMVVVLTASLTTPAFTSNEGKMRVWVEFEPGHGQNVEKALNGAGAEFHYQFDDLNSFVVTVPEQALNGLRHNPNVVSIEEDAPRYMAVEDYPYGIDMVQAPQVWDADGDGNIDADAPTGAGITVCIIDSGLFTGHEEFANVNIIGGYPTGWDTDRDGHGTHVAGTIVAGLNNAGVVGVSPGELSLYIVKVFGDDGSWAYASTLTDAANRCAAAGADVISMSLGGPSMDRREMRAFDSLYSQGVLSIAAAGNDGNTEISYPGGYDSVMSVAAVDENKAIADFSQQNSTVEIAAPGVAVLSSTPYITTDILSVDGVDYEGVHVEFAEYGSVSAALADGGLCTATDSALSGKIALCSRGEISFYDKVLNAKNSGAVAAVIYNNEEGALHATLGEAITSGIPAIGMTMADGQYLVANKLGQTANLVTTIDYDVSGYQAWDGTSMATPHVSGVAALVWSADPTWTNAEIRDALVSTAEDLGDPGRDVAFGYGLVQAKAALDYLGGSTPPPPPPPEDETMLVSITTDKATYVDRNVVQITVSVVDEAAGTAVSGAAVSLNVTAANGTQKALSGTTDASGVVTLSYRISTRKGGTGTYTIDAAVSSSGYLDASASATFQVQ